MKVFALGGYGTFGRHVAKNLCASDMVTEIVIVSRENTVDLVECSFAPLVNELLRRALATP